MPPLMREVFLDLFGVDDEWLVGDEARDRLVKAVRAACEIAGARVLRVCTTSYPLQGGSALTILFTLAESHIAVSTFPEESEGRAVLVDIATCRSIDPHKIAAYLMRAIPHEAVKKRYLERG